MIKIRIRVNIKIKLNYILRDEFFFLKKIQTKYISIKSLRTKFNIINK